MLYGGKNMMLINLVDFEGFCELLNYNDCNCIPSRATISSRFENWYKDKTN